ncbi:MAG: DUF2264 domain-containing protein [OCS116 cluster bacterium]|nr:DUF2264 domain-containing protein [OCS116 cluster bacterium]
MGNSKSGWYADPSVVRLTANNPLHNNPFKTRHDMQQAMADLFAPIRPHYSTGGARLQLNTSAAIYDIAAAELEGFSRPLWGIVPLVAGGGEFADFDIYLNGLTAGTDPQNREYWGALKGTDQRMVEMAAIGFALLMIPEKIYAPLSLVAQNNLADWLRLINQYPTPDNNWRFFRILVNLGLQNVGQVFSSSHLTDDFAALDRFYTSDGWYTDGMVNQMDYYIPFAMHFYGLLLSKLAVNSFPFEAEKYRDRARLFAQDFQYFFGADGAAVPYGRSMTYRFAQSAFWSAAAFADVEAMPWGDMKGHLLRNFRWWGEQPIAERDGVLSIGYAYPNLIMSEQYNAPGSPYWALKSFAALAVPEDHAFWQAEESVAQDLPAKPVGTQPVGFLARRAKGEVVLLNGGQTGKFHRHNAAKYGKFAYSSEFTFSVSSDNAPCEEMGRHAFDSTMAMSFDGKAWQARALVETSGIEQDLVYGLWQPKDGIKIETWQSFGEDGWHFRVHKIDTDVEFDMIETGFAIDRTDEQILSLVKRVKIADGSVCLYMPFGMSAIMDMDGDRTADAIQAWPNTNLRFPRTAIPQLSAKVGMGKSLYVTAIFAMPDENMLLSKPALPESINNLISQFK